MKKNLIAMGVAAALSAPMAAQALDAGNGHNVEIYGRFQAEWTDISSDVSGSDNDPLFIDDLAASKWGIFATEKLGNGWTAFGRFEFEEDTDENNTDSVDRNQYVGLKGNWGLFLAGRHDTPYKFTGGTKADPFIATHLEARRGGGMSGGLVGHAGRADNVLVYASPDFQGANFTVAYNAENDDEVDSGGGGVASPGPVDSAGFYSIGANYKNGPVWVWAAYNDGQDWEILGDEYSGWKVGGSYTFGNHNLRAQYEDQDGYTGAVAGDSALAQGGASSFIPTAEEADFLWLAYTLSMGNNALMLSYGEENYDDAVSASSGDDREVKSYTVALRHKMSKTFNIFGGWKRYELEANSASAESSLDGDDIDVLTIGLRKDFKI